MARSANNPDGGADAALAAVRAHLPGATKASDVGAEPARVAHRTRAAPALFRDLDSRIAEMGFARHLVHDAGRGVHSIARGASEVGGSSDDFHGRVEAVEPEGGGRRLRFRRDGC